MNREPIEAVSKHRVISIPYCKIRILNRGIVGGTVTTVKPDDCFDGVIALGDCTILRPLACFAESLARGHGVTSTEDFLSEYDDLSQDVAATGYKLFEPKLTRWFAYIDDSPLSGLAVAKLEGGVDFDKWYSDGRETGGSFVGSKTLNWPSQTETLLGYQLNLLRRMASEEIPFTDFCVEFLYTENNYDDMVRSIVDQIFLPAARDLRRLLSREFDRSSGDVPASDRLVSIDHNSAEYRSAADALDQTIDAVRGSNEFAERDPLGYGQRLAELEAGKRLILAPRARAIAIWEVLVKPLRWLAVKFAEGIIGAVAGAAVAAILFLFG